MRAIKSPDRHAVLNSRSIIGLATIALISVSQPFGLATEGESNPDLSSRSRKSFAQFRTADAKQERDQKCNFPSNLRAVGFTKVMDDSDEGKKAARKILDEIVSAHGGQKNIKRLTESTILFKGTRDVGAGPLNCQLLATPQGYLKEASKTDVDGFDGTHSWTGSNDRFHLDSQSVESSKAFYKNYEVMRVLSATKPDAKLVSVEPLMIDDLCCPGISVNLSTNIWLSIWTSPLNHLVAYTCYSMSDSAGMLLKPETSIEFGDYRTVCGFLVPFKKNVFAASGRETLIWTKVNFVDSRKIVMPQSQFDLRRPVTLPFHFRHGHIVLDGLINGREAKIFLDSGAIHSSLSKLSAEKFGIPIDDNSEPKSINTLFSTIYLRPGSMETFAIGGLTLRNLPVLIGSVDEDHYTFTLGMDVLQKYSVKFDFRKRLVTFFHSHQSEFGSGYASLPFKFTDAAYLYGSINGKPSSPFLIDTGSPYFAIVQTFDNPKKESTESESPKRSDLRDITGTKGDSVSGQIDEIQFLGLTCKNAECEFIKPTQASKSNFDILGIIFLYHFPEVILDFPKNRLILKLPKSNSLPSTIDCSKEKRPQW